MAAADVYGVFPTQWGANQSLEASIPSPRGVHLNDAENAV